VLLIAAPILIQVYFNASLAYGLMRLLKAACATAAAGAPEGKDEPRASLFQGVKNQHRRNREQAEQGKSDKGGLAETAGPLFCFLYLLPP
jgi:hypothetical protein